MAQYIRNQNPGNTYFFTVCLADLHSDLLVTQVQLLRDAVKLCQKQRPFTINAAVILPATAHMIWTLPAQDADYSARWRQIKSTFSRHVLMPDRRQSDHFRTKDM
jgi:putative transposase